MDDIISKLKTPQECIQFAEKCTNLAHKAYLRAIELRTLTHGEKNEVETELLKAIYAYEEVDTSVIYSKVNYEVVDQYENRGVYYTQSQIDAMLAQARYEAVENYKATNLEMIKLELRLESGKKLLTTCN